MERIDKINYYLDLAEQNAIISAERNKMIDATLFLVGKNYKDRTFVKNSIHAHYVKE